MDESVWHFGLSQNELLSIEKHYGEVALKDCEVSLTSGTVSNTA